jgi:hypothetical protein
LSLRRTALREIAEEADKVDIPDTTPSLLALELGDRPFVQLTYLGVDTPPNSIVSGKMLAEGIVHEWDFDEFGRRLKTGDWVPSGRMAYLAWLFLGAPTTMQPGFDRNIATKMYLEVITALKG